MARKVPKYKTLEIIFFDDEDDKAAIEILEEIMRKSGGLNAFERYWIQDFGDGDRYFLDMVAERSKEEINEVLGGYFDRLKKRKQIDDWQPFDKSIIDLFVENVDEINFNSLFSVTAQTMKESYIRLLLALLQEPDMISFAGGIPDPDAFPIETVGYLLNKKIMVKDDDFKKAKMALQYTGTAGIDLLRKQTLEVADKTLKIKNQELDNIIITTGSQQALYGLSHILINKWDSIVVEAPTYLGALNPFKMHTSKFYSVDLRSNGPNVPQLVKILEKRHPKFVYLIPNFQNPSGVTTSKDVREEIYDVVCKHNKEFTGSKKRYKTIIIEDDPYGSLRYEKKHIPSLKSMDTEDIVVYLGSFSKIFAPGIRVGCMIARKDIVEKLIGVKQSYDLHSSSFSQLLAYEFLAEGGHVSGHIKKIKKVYSEKMEAMLNALDESGLRRFGFTYTRPEGGMFLWMTGPNNFNAKEILENNLLNKEYMADLNKRLKAENPKFKEFKNRVAFVPGEPFYATDPKLNTARINFSKPSIEEIKEGVRILSKVLPDSLGFFDKIASD
ncbi:PLP-dependent aminotransferase family protein [Candidatus Undinarchaeota archaeon]